MPRPPHPLPTSGPPNSIAKTPFLLKQTSPIATSSPESFFFVDVSIIVGHALPSNNRDVVSDADHLLVPWLPFLTYYGGLLEPYWHSP